ncbi:heat shock transcription factor, Y-linked-like [Camelus ferus]|uniref:Heat shock transcription factor, Y-linked-like n=1 Tax=Camelus ferus TaxID=419612 RepID=A0A8B8RXG6_CAMFR|nr:heat shock transcription factor, Y-linked-like [Camelus ferus]
MSHVSSENQDVSPKNASENSSRPPLCDHTFARDLELRSVIEENAFQALSEGSLTKSPCYTFSVSEPDENDDFLSLTFPRKLWKLVGSDQFKSIWWDESGTLVVIDEDLFKKEVLERKAPFRIFKTGSLKTLVRQLNLYGFRKVQQNFQRSASPADFLAEGKQVSTLSKLQFYHNPHFKRGCPQLLVRIKRRVGINVASAVSSLAQDFNKKHFKAGGNEDTNNCGLGAGTSGASVLSTSENLNVPFIRKPSTSQRTLNTATPIRNDFSPPSSMSARPSEQTAVDQHAILNQLTTFHVHSQSSYTQANGRILNFITTVTSTSQYRIVSPVQSSYVGLVVEPSTFQTRYPDVSANGFYFSNLQPAGNLWFQMPMIAHTSVASLSRPTHQPSSGCERHPNYN